MIAILEVILTQILEFVFIVIGYFTGAVLVRVLSLGYLHVYDRTEESLELYWRKQEIGWRITYVEDGKRYVMDWFVCVVGIAFWIGLIFVLYKFVVV